MLKQLLRLFRKTPKVHNEPKPLLIEPFDGGVTVYGTDAENYIIVGKTQAPDPTRADFDLTDHHCIVTMIDGTIERHDPNAVELLHALADLLGYTVRRQKSRDFRTERTYTPPTYSQSGEKGE